MTRQTPGRLKKSDDAKVSIFCPYCGLQHIDHGMYAIKPHKIHLCLKCGKKFNLPRATIGVRYQEEFF